MTSFADAQGRAWANKVAKGFNTTDVPMEFCLLLEEVAEAKVRGRFGEVLRDHYLMNVICDPERKMDNPVCGCSRVFLGWYSSIGAARDAWIGHVMDVVSGNE